MMGPGTSSDMVDENQKVVKNLMLEENVKPKRTTVGRPTAYRKEFCQKLIEHMEKGYSFESFAGVLGYASIGSVYRWVDKHPSFREAKKIGEAKSYLWLESVSRGAMMGKIPNFNSTVWIFTMKNRFGWKDRHHIKSEHTHKEIKEIVHQVEIGLDGDITQHKLEIAK